MKYKLIKKYPGLPDDWEVGMKIGLGDNRMYHTPCSGKYNDIIVTHPQKWPKYWKPVIELNYPIGTKFKKTYDGKIYTLETINSSDEVIITNNPSTNWMEHFSIEEVNRFFLNRIWIEHKPLFVTNDEVEIYQEDSFWYVINDMFINYSNSANDKFTPHTSFSTKEKAEEYILWNKPSYSLNDLKEVIEKVKLQKMEECKNQNYEKASNLRDVERDLEEILKMLKENE